MKKILRLDFLPINPDLALFILRIWIGFSLFYKHGIEKLTNFQGMATHFPDPIHIGVKPSLAFALLSDGICSVLVMLGLGTRLAATVIAINLLVVFTILHGLSFVDGHAELVYAYLGVFIILVIAGGGKYSLDEVLVKNKK
jgi:putative oxidoreductase